jgi:hypothetical protein
MSDVLPATASVPEAGKLFFGCGREKAYRLAKAGVIETIKTGPKGVLALMHVTARKLGIDPTT